MALQGTDLLVVQSQDDKQLYKLRIDALNEYLEGSSGVQFKGSVDLNNGAGAQTPDAITLPATNGDLYIVESDAATINADWIMESGVTSASENDRIIWDAPNDEGGGGYWVLVSGGSSTGGLIETITATEPLLSDNDPTNPVLNIRKATTTESGYVVRLATSADVIHSNNSAPDDAVVTADLLNVTNKRVEDLSLAAGGVQTVTYVNSDSNDAINITPTSGNVTLDLKNATESSFGAVKIATATEIDNGTSGASAMVDASQLKAVKDDIPSKGIQKIEEDKTADCVSGALKITEDGDKEVTIGVNNAVFAPFDFSNLPNITP